MTFAIKSMGPPGRHMRGTIVTCGHCGVVRTVQINHFKGQQRDNDDLEQQFIRNKLEKDGWLIGKKAEQHRCPGCYSAIRSAQKRKNEENVVNLPIKPGPTKPEQPREMSRDDRRIIFEKLNEVYVDEKTGYGPGWTDAKVASDLGVPRAWVKGLRDEMFGPEGSNEEIRATICDAQILLNDIRVVANAVQGSIEPLKTILDKAERIEKRIAQIQQELR
ncbi:hypothetical protein I6F35_33545 [Bradyrhizobium sp. BRP22]|uniref:hypothetical protein n=1 Tax=Bradyrhizobium sp. BRP22 TaxID=2793821 RepID=UPI001CD511A4|nr:hypothetical protein [Bradyrhizobium sp. BRP22]MCA1458060.1 hypothetical protein [Bradyrhizobium sp. BRP22]